MLYLGYDEKTLIEDLTKVMVSIFESGPTLSNGIETACQNAKMQLNADAIEGLNEAQKTFIREETKKICLKYLEQFSKH